MRIKFLLDENIPYTLIDLLRNRGFDVQHLKKMGKRGIKNGEVYEIAENEKSWIITRDADFQNLEKELVPAWKRNWCQATVTWY